MPEVTVSLEGLVLSDPPTREELQQAWNVIADVDEFAVRPVRDRVLVLTNTETNQAGVVTADLITSLLGFVHGSRMSLLSMLDDLKIIDHSLEDLVSIERSGDLGSIPLYDTNGGKLSAETSPYYGERA